jgi:hypothetical protein
MHNRGNKAGFAPFAVENVHVVELRIISDKQSYSWLAQYFNNLLQLSASKRMCAGKVRGTTSPGTLKKTPLAREARQATDS